MCSKHGPDVVTVKPIQYQIFELGRKSDGCEGRIGILDRFGPGISHSVMKRGMSRHHPGYIHQTDSDTPR